MDRHSFLGKEYVKKQGLMFSLLEFLGEPLVVTLQQLNRRCYEVIVPLALGQVFIPKTLPPLISMGYDIDDTKVVCKYL